MIIYFDDMNLKKLERATKALEKIKSLDSEIVELEKIAELLANGETEVKLSMSIQDLKPIEDTPTEKPTESLQDYLDAARSSMFVGWRGMPEPKKQDKNIKKYDATISAKNGLYILSALLMDKQEKRKYYIDQLNYYGIQL